MHTPNKNNGALSHNIDAYCDASVHIPIPKTAHSALDVLNDAGWTCWIVGGFVRDALLGKPDHDIDIATNAPWKETQRCFEAHGYHTFETGVAHGTLSVKVANDVFEITTYRTDGTYSDGRHPDSVTFVDDIRKDLARRDFTINAMAYHPLHGLLDIFGGRADLAHKRIRCVGDPRQRFKEDALRILRAVRFSSQLDFSIDPSTQDGMDAEKEHLRNISVERIEHEMEGFLCGKGIHDALMKNIDVIGTIIPELMPLKGFDQHSKYHIYDVLEHTAYTTSYVRSTPVMRWAALLHDVGKPRAFTIKNGVGHFYGHPRVSAEMARAILRRLKVRPRMVRDICTLIAFHDTHITPDRRNVKNMIVKMGGRPDLFFDLCDLKQADARAHAPKYQEEAPIAHKLSACLHEILDNHEPLCIKDMPISGKDIINMGVAPGPAVGTILQSTFQALIDEKVPNDRAQLLAWARSETKHLKENQKH